MTSKNENDEVYIYTIHEFSVLSNFLWEIA